MAGFTIRDAELEDAARLLEIYSYYVERTAITYEWEVPTLDDFRERMRRTMARYPYLVAAVDGRPIGYAYAGPFVGRKAYDWSVELSIYLDHAARHRGAGKRLYLAMERALRLMNVTNLNACIGYPKEDDAYLTKNSAQFHAHMGYRLVGEFHDCAYKFGTWYDMVWMEKAIAPHPAVPQPVRNYNSLKGSIDFADLARSC